MFYDYANSGKKIILFAYDRKEYESSRGMYETIDSYPFDILKKQRRSFHLHTAPVAHRTMLLCKNMPAMKDGHGAEKICRQVFLHEDCCRKYQYHGNGKKNILILCRRLDLNGITTVLYSQLHELDLTRYNYFIFFPFTVRKRSPGKDGTPPGSVGIYPLASEMNMDLLTMAVQLLKLKGHTGSWAEHRLHTAYRREWKKHFGSTEFACVIHYNGYEAYTTSLLEEAPCPRSIWIHNDMGKGSPLERQYEPLSSERGISYL